MPGNARFNDPQHWRNRAEEARILAEQMPDDLSRATMRKIAEDYDKIAERALVRVAGDRRAG